MAFQHTFTADGQSDDFIAQGPLTIHQKGVYGSGSVVLQLRIPGGGTYDDLTDTAQTADNDQEVLMNGQNVYRLDMSGSTTPSVVVTVMAENIRKA